MHSYTFVRPDDNIYINYDWSLLSQEDSNSYTILEAGDSLQVSEACNPNFIHYFFLEPHIKYNCDAIMNMGMCGTTVLNLIHYSQWNTNGLLETFLQCPQCGCGQISEGAANLDDLYAVEQDRYAAWQDSYTFFRPEFNRPSIQVSGSCNPNFIVGNPNNKQYDCDELKDMDACDIKVVDLINNGQWNTNGILETFLHCPQCGCGSKGAANLNDLYAAEQDGSRNASDANTIFNEPLQ